MSNCKLRSFEVANSGYLSAAGDVVAAKKLNVKGKDVDVSRRKAKSLSRSAATASEATPQFRDSMIVVYNNLFNRPHQTKTEAVRNINKENGTEAVFQVVRTFGSPRNKKDLEMHNGYVAYFQKYFIPDDALPPQNVEECAYLDGLIEQMENEEEKLNKQQSAKGKAIPTEAGLRALANRISVAKNLKSKSSCDALVAAAAEQKEQKETLELLKSQTQGTGADKTTKTIAYGLAGLVVVVGLVVLLKRKG
jgi:hypothetical protein